jgi:hypothetical protein
MRCLDCGKKESTPEDWGDYDDACEWACNCPRDGKSHFDDEVIQYGAKI